MSQSSLNRKNGTSSSAVPPKLVIKPFKVQPKIPDNFEEISWSKLKQAIKAIYEKVAMPQAISKEELYQCVEDLCLNRMSIKLYNNLKDEIEIHVKQLVATLGQQTSDLMAFLNTVDIIWKEYIEQIGTVRNIFLYLDRTYALQTVGAKPIMDLSLHLFSHHLINHKNVAISSNTNSNLSSTTPDVIQKLIVSLLFAIENDRRGNLLSTDREMLRRLFRMLSSLHFYTLRFESIFIQDSIRFFKLEGQLLMQETTSLTTLITPTASVVMNIDSSSSITTIDNNNISNSGNSSIYFMHRVEYRLKEAHDMISSYLEYSTKAPLIQVIETQMLTPHMLTVIERGLKPLLVQACLSSSSNNINNTALSFSSASSLTAGMSTISTSNLTTSDVLIHLRRLYYLCDRVHALEVLKNAWGHFIKNAGDSIVHNNNTSGSGNSGSGSQKGNTITSARTSSNERGERDKDKTLVIDELLLFQDRLELILSHCFHSNDSFKASMKNAFELFLNEKQTKQAELIARFVDKKLKGDKTVMSETEMEQILDKSMKLFRFLQEKDIFEAFYKKMLSRRLLLNRSANYEMEKIMLSKLKAECGSNFTSKLEGMFQDIELSRDVMTAYVQHMATMAVTVTAIHDVSSMNVSGSNSNSNKVISIKHTPSSSVVMATGDMSVTSLMNSSLLQPPTNAPTSSSLSSVLPTLSYLSHLNINKSATATSSSNKANNNSSSNSSNIAQQHHQQYDESKIEYDGGDTARSVTVNNNNNNNSSRGVLMRKGVSSSNSYDGSNTSISTPEFNVQVLTTGYWPSHPNSENLILPGELLTVQEQFNTFYVNKYQGRRLVWEHSLERCLLTTYFPRCGKKELEVSFFQALVLLTFNKLTDTNATMTFQEISISTNMEEGEMKRTLLSLACGPIGTRVLIKQQQSASSSSSGGGGGSNKMSTMMMPMEINVATDVFRLNNDFTSKLYRVKINSIQMKESVEEVEQTHEEVFQERQHQVDAAIVRTMKARKTLSHTSLISELMSQLKFPARSQDLKKRIESLIEREYLARDKDDSTAYVYLA